MPIGRAASKGYDRTRRKGAFVASQLNKLTRHFEGDAQIGGSNETLLSIGQMARLNAVSEKALRLYQAKGILEPATQTRRADTATTRWGNAPPST